MPYIIYKKYPKQTVLSDSDNRKVPVYQIELLCMQATDFILAIPVIVLS